MKYIIEQLNETSYLANFKCGVSTMDTFIQDGLELSIENHYCRAYSVIEENTNNVIAIFALSFDSLDLDYEDKDDMMSGISSAEQPLLTNNYKEVFLNKSRYPALEIAYLAVSVNQHKRGIGRSIVESIVEKAQEQKLAGCQFITVEALSSDLYNAVGFYSRCGFAPCEMPNPNKGTLRMFRTLYPLALEKDVI